MSEGKSLSSLLEECGAEFKRSTVGVRLSSLVYDLGIRVNGKGWVFVPHNPGRFQETEEYGCYLLPAEDNANPDFVSQGFVLKQEASKSDSHRELSNLLKDRPYVAAIAVTRDAESDRIYFKHFTSQPAEAEYQ